MATRVFDRNKFCEHFLKKTSQGTFLLSMVHIGLAVLEEEMFEEIVDDKQRTTQHKQRTTDNPKSSPCAHYAKVS